ncbi:uncharacterized protein METZ01_LOCUS448883, partial [marine metagenome]
TASEFISFNKYDLQNNPISNNSIEYYATFSEIYRNIPLFYDPINNKKNIKVERDLDGKIIKINWDLEEENTYVNDRKFEYNNNDLLIKIVESKNNQIIKTTIIGENDIGSNFFDYIFSPGFTPRKYNYFTEIFFEHNMPKVYMIFSMNGDLIGKISKTYDKQNHLHNETWHKGESCEILREFTSIFNHQTGHHNLIEQDANGQIVNHINSLIN